MYQNIYHDHRLGNIHVWDDIRGYRLEKYEQYGYLIDSKGEHETLTGYKCKKVTSWTDIQKKQGVLFEHDVPSTTRFLVDKYFESDEVSVSHKVLFLDIEIAKEGKYSKPKDADNTVTSISYWDNVSKKYVCLLLSTELKDRTLNDGNILKCYDSELKLLLSFINQFPKIDPTIISGWNIETFDMPYLYNRIKKICGKKWADKLSPIEVVEQRDLEKRGDVKITIAGRSILDYLVLYKKYTYFEESSYALNAISKKELNREKIQYDGNLDSLYATDINKFIEYNITDVELVVELDRKLDYIELTRGICHKGHVPYEDHIFSSKVLDGAALTFCKRQNKVADKIAVENKNVDEPATGAYVKTPKPGLYEWIFDLDQTSMYPMNIISLNISPETKFGKVLNWDENNWISKEIIDYSVLIYSKDIFEDDKLINITSIDFQEFLDEHSLSIASNGCLYLKDKIGFLPSILSTWFTERKEYSKLANEYHNAGDIEQYQYYDKKQLVTKILLNSFYGVLLLPTFRFYDKDNGEAVTITGQHLIKFAEKAANWWFNRRLETNNIDYVQYVDTDSVFLSAKPVLDKEIPNSLDSVAIEYTLKITGEVQEFINRAYDYYALRAHNIENHKWNIKQELIGRRAFWGNVKKRYAIWIVNKKGVTVDELEVKGLEIVRSSFPKAFRSFFRQTIVDVLNNKSAEYINSEIRKFKEKYRSMEKHEFLLPTGVKEMSKYTKGQKGAPVHVKSAQNYNQLISLFKLNTEPIQDGDKILWGYLHNNPYGFESIAIKGYDDDDQIMNFIDKFIDKEKIFNNSLMSKLGNLYSDLNFGTINISNTNSFF